MTAAQTITVYEQTHVAAARRAAAGLARQLGFDETAAARAALVATEAATNLIKHGSGGELVVQALRQHPAPGGVELIALDKGPGLSDLGACLEDGFSTAGSPGTGLGAIARQADLFDIYSTPQTGTALLAQLWAAGPNGAAPPEIQFGGLSLPKRGQEVCGDGWAAQAGPAGPRLIVVDGLGHGPSAADAAQAALRTFRAHPDLPLVQLLHTLHSALRATRGAAVAVADLDLAQRQVHFAGLGNIAGLIWSEGNTRHLVSHNGTLGHALGRVQTFTYPWPREAVLVMHSDGLSTQAGLDAYPGLAARHPALIAAVLYRDFNRGRDDACVVAAKDDRGAAW